MKPSLVPTRSLRANIIAVVIISDLHFYRYIIVMNALWLLAHLSNLVLRTRKLSIIRSYCNRLQEF